MPFTKGNKLAKGHGRKGFEIEDKQRKEMEKLLSKYLVLAAKIGNGKELDVKELIAFNRLEKLVLKIADKLHANKTDIKLDVEKPIMIL